MCHLQVIFLLEDRSGPKSPSTFCHPSEVEVWADGKAPDGTKVVSLSHCLGGEGTLRPLRIPTFQARQGSYGKGVGVHQTTFLCISSSDSPSSRTSASGVRCRTCMCCTAMTRQARSELSR